MSLLEVQNLVVEFPGRRGTLRALDDISLHHRTGRDPGRGGRVRRRQVASPARPSSACSSRPGASPRDEILLEGQRIDNLPPDRDAAHPRPQDRRDLPGPAHLAEPALHHRPAAGGDHPDPPAGQRGRSAPARDRPAGGHRHPGGRAAHRPLPAPVLRRHAAARRHRAGARRRAQADRGRRADHGARRLDPGADHPAAQAHLPRPRRGRHADHARHGRDRRDLRPRGRDVCRAHRRDRPGARGDPPACASLHDGPDGFHPRHRRSTASA